jgi:hypothetical protein
MERFGGDLDHVREFLQKAEERHIGGDDHPRGCRRERREELKTKYATQLAELAAAGINTNGPCVLRQLEKNQGDVNKV